MRQHNQRILDLRYQKAMVAKTRSSDPQEAAIGRQGLALRSSCIRSKQNSIKSKQSSLNSKDSSVASSLSSDEEPPGGATLSRCNTDLTEVEIDKQMEHVFQAVAPWKPGSFGQREDAKRASNYAAVIAAKSEPRHYQKVDPTRIAEPSTHMINMRGNGSCFWFQQPNPPVKVKMSYNELPLLEQQQRVAAHVYGQQIVMTYPDWNKPKCKGVGRYRMSIDLPQDQTIRNLVHQMGNIADCLGIVGDLPIAEFEGINISSLLCVKYEKEMRKKLQGPTEQFINGTHVVRGFLTPWSKRLKGAETFLKPLTYAAFEFQSYDRISEHRLVHNHYFNGKECEQAEMLKKDRRGEAKEITSPRGTQIESDTPVAVGFKLSPQPEQIQLPDRHPGIENSDLEALACNPMPVGNPKPTTAPVAVGNQAVAPTNGQLQPQKRPALRRKSSEAKAKPKKSKATTLGNKRTTSIVEPVEQQEEAGPSNTETAAAAANDQAVAADTLNALIDGAASPEYMDSPPSYLLATSSMEKAAIKRTLRPESPRLVCLAENSPPQQAWNIATPHSRTTTLPLTPANSASPNATSLPRSIPNSSSSHTLVNSATQANIPKSPAQAVYLSLPTSQQNTACNPSCSASVENRLSDPPKRCVRWETNLIHTNEQSGFKPHSIYNYSKNDFPNAPTHELSGAAVEEVEEVEEDDEDQWEEA